MCGIAGFNWPDDSLIRAMTLTLLHRGPDDEGFFVDDRVSLGHRRLSIIDLSEAGHQPMLYQRDGRRALITFNGEIFNFREIRKVLEQRGYKFNTSTDTEIILAAYFEWGHECVSRFNGMWSFAIYDPQDSTIFLSRDRFGEKPLYISNNAGKLIFASEIKAILAHPVRRRANAQVVSDYLYRGRANGSLETFFEGIEMLPPSHNAHFDLRTRRMTFSRYYEPRRDCRRVTSEEFRETLKKSVERRLISDVPISISLSGGTDSTSVAALTAQLTDSSIKAFTTATDDRSIGDERAQIARFVDRYPQFKLESSNISMDGFCHKYEKIIYHMDEPFVRQSAYVRWEIAELTRRHERKVLLNGEGADEILGGYVPFAAHSLADLAGRFRLIRFTREMLATAFHPERKRIVEALRDRFSSSRVSKAKFVEQSGNMQRRFGIRLAARDQATINHSSVKDYLYSLVFDYSLPRLLNCNDKMTMAHSVEGRAPFLDHEFVDMAFSMDPADFMVSGWRKYPLRSAMKDFVPEEIMFRKSKEGFNAPVFDYLRSVSIQRRVEELFKDSYSASIFDPIAYKTEYQSFLSRRGGNGAFLLHGLLLEEWMRMFAVDFS